VITGLLYKSSGMLVVNAFRSHSVTYQHPSTQVHCWTASAFSAGVFKIWAYKKNRRKYQFRRRVLRKCHKIVTTSTCTKGWYTLVSLHSHCKTSRAEPNRTEPIRLGKQT